MVSFGSKNRAIGVSAKNQVGRFLAFVNWPVQSVRVPVSVKRTVVKPKKLNFPCYTFYFRNAALFCHASFREMQYVVVLLECYCSLSLMLMFSS